MWRAYVALLHDDQQLVLVGSESWRHSPPCRPLLDALKQLRYYQESAQASGYVPRVVTKEISSRQQVSSLPTQTRRQVPFNIKTILLHQDTSPQSGISLSGNSFFSFLWFSLTPFSPCRRSTDSIQQVFPTKPISEKAIQLVSSPCRFLKSLYEFEPPLRHILAKL